MPRLPHRPGQRPASGRTPLVVVLGDLALDVGLAPTRPLELGTDVPGRVTLRQGGSAANAAKWLARLGIRTTLVCAVGRDGPGRALVAALRADGVTVRAARPVGSRTARIGMVVDPATGERSFVADRGAADSLTADDLDPAWFAGATVLHLPAYSLLGDSLGRAARAAVAMARAGGSRVSVDLASAGPLLVDGRRAAHALIANVGPDLLFTNHHEADAFLGEPDPARLLRFAPVAIVKRGPAGATVLVRPAGGGGPEGGASRTVALRFDVATRPLAAADTTGAGDAFDAGFLAMWCSLGEGGVAGPGALRRAVATGHRTAARQLLAPRSELVFS